MKGFKVNEICLEERFPQAVAVTAMASVGNTVYVGLTSMGPVLIEMDTASGRLIDTGFGFPKKGDSDIHDKIHNALVNDPGEDGLFYTAHDVNISWSQWGFSPEQFTGGHLYSFNVQTGRQSDLGIVTECNVPHTIALGEGFLFGYTIPDNHLFSYDIKKKKVTDFGNVIGDFCNHNMVCSGTKAFGGYYISGNRERSGKPQLVQGVYLFVYDHSTGSLQKTETRITCGPADGIYGGNRGIDAWLKTSDGRMYGGLADGKMVSLDAGTMEVKELGIARLNGGPRLPCLAESADGIVWGAAGWPLMGLFSFNPATGEFMDYGVVTEKYPMCYFHAMVVLPDGRIYLGETDSNRPHVYELEPE